MNELSTILTTIISTVVPLISTGAWMYRRQNKKLKDAEVKLAEANVGKAKVESKADEWHIWKEQLEAEREHVKFKDERIEQLLKMNADKEDRHQQDIREWEERFDKSVDRTREVQRENAKLHEDKIALITENGELRLELEKKKCEDLPCPFRLPPNAHTKPIGNVTKDEYFKTRTIKVNGN